MDCCRDKTPWWKRWGQHAKERERVEAGDLKKVALVGNPNVGKSVLFNRLTGLYVTVSNYPGTTVEVSRGKGNFGGEDLEVIDTPGMYSLLPITEEERVARRLLITESPSAVLHVVDARNLERMLPLTFQLIEAGLPLILVLNIMDEARRRGVHIDCARLAAGLGIPVVPVSAALNQGIDVLREKVREIAVRAA
ncbi:MAG TPA: GTP-binding protein [Firmicutes bacterium]|nr:GTP-binding protein [Bacillota bacterium]